MLFFMWLYSFFLCMSGLLTASSLDIPQDMLGPVAPSNTVRNKIFSTVKDKPIYTQQVATTNQITDPEVVSADTKKSILSSSVVSKQKQNTQVVQSDSEVLSRNKDESASATKDQSFLQGAQASTEENSSLNFDKSGHTEQKQSSALKKSDKKVEKDTLYQEPGFIDNQGTVAFNFEDSDLASIASYMETIHNIKFVTEDILSTNKDAKGLAGHKVSFRTNKVLSKKESWDLFITFLHMAGLDLVPMAQAGFYKIVPFTKANSEAIPSYIGMNADLLPDNDMIVRYVYFAQNIDPVKVQQIIVKMQGGSAKLDIFSELKALIFTDRSRNIKSLMQIVRELDQAVLPETLSVLKLKKANVNDVIKLYKSLKSSSSPGSSGPQRAWAPGKKEATLDYFPQDVSTFGDNRTNSLILLGPEKGVKRIEEFIEKYIDVEVASDAPPVFTYQLQYTTATNIQPILSKIVQYGPGGASAQGGSSGGVRDGVQYFQNMTIIPETHSNKLIINSTKEDFEALKPLIEELDIPQKQVGLEVLIVQVSNIDTKSLGAQISAPQGANNPNGASTCQSFAQSISAQTSGIMNTAGGGATSTVVTQNQTTNELSIKSGLSKLLGTSVVNEAGSILLTFGQPIWAIFKVLKRVTSTHVVANPFIVVSNNSPAEVSTGEERRVVSSETPANGGEQSVIKGFTPSSAKLGFTITPQINKGNIVNMQIKVQNEQFTGEGENNALKSNNVIDTYASVANGEVLALGGIMAETYGSSNSGVPFLENIPVFGWFFKSKTKTLTKNHFLVFISPRLLDPVNDQNSVDNYTKYKMHEADENMKEMDSFEWFAARKDPIHRAFFGDDSATSIQGLTRKKILKDKKKKKRVYKKKGRNKKEDVISFDQDFLQSKNQEEKKVKHSIFKSMSLGNKNA